MPYHVCRCGFTWQSFRELFESVRTAMAWPEDSWLAGGEWLRYGDDNTSNVIHEGLFRKLQREAREAERGLWR